MSEVGVVIPATAGREENLRAVLTCLNQQTALRGLVVVDDGGGITGDWGDVPFVRLPKHEPGMEQPRNIGVRALTAAVPEVTHVWFLDSDVIVEEGCLEVLRAALDAGLNEDRIVVAPYDWMGPGQREPAHDLRNDPRWVSFTTYDPVDVLFDDLAAGLACFSGNLLWPVEEFKRVGGFWSELHHGRCEDGELGLRAVSMGVGISFAREARGWHLHHPVDTLAILARNQRDVPMLNARHPWVQEGGVFMVDRDGKAFDVECWKCKAQVPTSAWWAHAGECGILPELPI